MDRRLLLYRAKAWLKFHLTAWNTGGEGVHSPYLFEWVRMVMSDKHGYYKWNEIEACRERMLLDNRVLRYVDYGKGSLFVQPSVDSECCERSRKGRIDERKVSDIAKGSLAQKQYAQMLFRLVNWLGHDVCKESKEIAPRQGITVVELGTSLGITTAYLASVDTRNRVLTYEGCGAVADVARENWRKLGLDNIACYVGEIDVEKLSEQVAQVDIAFIDANHTYASTLAYFNVLAEKVHKKSVIVVDDIHHSEEMERAWKEICADDRVTSTMDLFQMGLVFFDKYYWRRNYRMRL